MNQPLKVWPAHVGAAGNVIVDPWGPLMELTALPPSELNETVTVAFAVHWAYERDVDVINVYGEVSAVPPLDADVNQPLKVWPANVGAAGKVIVDTAGPLMN